MTTTDAMAVLRGMYAAEARYLAAGGPVVLTQVHARARATGRELDFPILQIVTVKDRCITEVRPFYWDTAAIASACGGQHQSPSVP